jgi:hypothetical protein
MELHRRRHRRRVSSSARVVRRQAWRGDPRETQQHLAAVLGVRGRCSVQPEYAEALPKPVIHCGSGREPKSGTELMTLVTHGGPLAILGVCEPTSAASPDGHPGSLTTTFGGFTDSIVAASVRSSVSTRCMPPPEEKWPASKLRACCRPISINPHSRR